VLEDLVAEAGLTQQEKAVAWDIADGYTQAEVAGRLGITQQRVSTVWGHTQEKFRNLNLGL